VSKNLIIISFLYFALFAVQKAQAEDSREDWYLSFNAASDTLQEASLNSTTTENFVIMESIDKEFNFSASFGYRLNNHEDRPDNKRIEAEFLWQNDTIHRDTGSVSTSGVMANAFYDFRSESPITPYIGGGAGIANIKIANSDKFGMANDVVGTVPAYQTMAGVAYTTESYPYTTMHFGYKFFKTTTPVYVDYSTHNIDASIRVAF
jgi:opacity protein-like surface antigen